ncbi:hypothetical protein MGYG_07197 [Nannizzia gypsea CBS 118893]|uniref:Uncharacterized protein n=1 Tax=Arthroderma gypseum (strain ATCC MYA-4604 / CBS 118893) TaxID=535722 RepID=E4V2C5_ARTGP|nr:hypothetical protein MGYG_07197 [Nannizzia gypsea CBS 118893]EFR04190.1 hypothetical protein MGYG_07197 [Nannizzia gypsea CBS 118893]
MSPFIGKPGANGALLGARGYGEPIAIIGMAARLPQEADTNENLWKFLLEARNSSTPFPSDRVNHEAHYHPDAEHAATFHSKGGHFITGNTINFDSNFFGLTKSEVMTMDPQQRILLENVYHALENAGIPLDKAMSSNASVYVSGFNHDHLQRLNFDPQATAKYKPTGSANSILANRVSWFFDFKSASVTVDSACSSSMVAIHLGCQSLRTLESDMSVVSGVNLLAWPNDYMAMSHHGFLSPDGKCYSFDHRANGYSRGEGVGTLILKRVSDAVKDGDTIRAVLRGTAINQDGRTAGITLPNASAQISLMRDAYARAGLDPKDTTFVEAHGTGTAAGDPIEARAIAHAFETSTREVPLYIGAMKSGVGHLEGASGVASVMKAVMMLESGIVVPNVNFEKVNEKIPLDSWKLHFPTQITQWPTNGIRRISVNSTGFGGTNSHAILEDAYSYLAANKLYAAHRTTIIRPTQKDLEELLCQLQPSAERNGYRIISSSAQSYFKQNSSISNGIVASGISNGATANGDSYSRVTMKGLLPLTFPVSAFDEDGVIRNAESLSAHLKTLPDMDKNQEGKYLSDLAYTLCKSRSEFAWRSYSIASTVSELSEDLAIRLQKPVRASQTHNLGFVFTGQGAQWFAMGRELFAYAKFRESIGEAEKYLKSLGCAWSLIEELHRDKSTTKINEPAVSHLGHPTISSSRALFWRDCRRIFCWKARSQICLESRLFPWDCIINKIPYQRRHEAVGASETELAPYMQEVHHNMSGELIIACYNSPISNTISGDETMVDALKILLDANDIFARKLAVSNAYHSNHMDAAATAYFTLLGDLKSDDKISYSTDIAMFSSVTGQLTGVDELESAKYWVDNLVSPVNFTKSLTSACFQPIRKGQKPVSINNSAENIFLHDILEIGPHGALQGPIKQCIAAHIYSAPINYITILNRNNPGLHNALSVPATLKCRGYPINLHKSNPIIDHHIPQRLVDLPPYSFNHTSRIWFESRLTKNFRLREHPVHDIFGVPVDDWNADEPRWRNVIRVHENPWLKEHVMTGSYIYPGVGYIAMAVEAAHQLSGHDLPVSGFRLRDISIKAALHIPDTRDGIEVMLYMSRMDESSSERSKVWSDFRIMSWNATENDWIEHTGYISVETDPKPNFTGHGFETQQEFILLQEQMVAAARKCQFPLDLTRFYENMSDKGLVFGPLFRNLANVKMSNGTGEATGVVTVPNVAQSMPKNFMRPHIIHPCTLDSMLHMSMMSILDCMEADSLPVAMLPTFMREVWISAATGGRPGHMFNGHGKSKMVAAQKYDTDIIILDAERREWKPDINLYKSNKMLNVAPVAQSVVDFRRQEVGELQLATMMLIMDALDELEGISLESLEGHFQNYYGWLKLQASILKADKMVHLPLAKWLDFKDDQAFKSDLYKEVASRSPEGELCIKAGSNIAKVLKNEVDPLHLLFGDDLLDQVYAESTEAGNLGGLLRSCLELIAHSKTDLNILEIGAGTGSLTAVLLETLSPIHRDDNTSGSGSNIAKYEFTDISASFFEKAKERFKAWKPILKLSSLNIENGLEEQGFSLGEYDIIVAGNVLHATKDLRKTLTNVRQLLKPDGRLIIHEGIRQDFLFVPVAFGFLEGWWLSVEDVRKWCPFINKGEWAKALQDTRFSDIEISLQDWDDADLNGISTFVASAIGGETYRAKIPDDILILMADSGQEAVATALKDRLLEKYGYLHYKIAKLSEIDASGLADVLCVSLIELLHPILADPSEQEYNNIRSLLSICKNVLWITGDSTADPHLNMAAGIMRTVRWERDLENSNLASLEILSPQTPLGTIVQAITDIVDHQFAKSHESKSNAEYRLQEGVIHTNRLVSATEMNDYLTRKSSKPKAQMMSLGEAEAQGPVRLTTEAPGMLNKLQFESDMTYFEPLGEDQLEVQVKAVGLNFRDIMIAMGQHDAITLGSEGSGVVTRVGSRVKDFKPGDRVIYMDGHTKTGAFQTYGRSLQNLAAIMPDNMSFEVAASLPSVYITSIYGLYEVAKLAKGETILIHSAAGGVGQAAIMLANIVGAEVFATVSTAEKAEVLMSRYGVRKDHIFSSRDLSFAQGIMRMTNGRGIDVFLNSLVGEFLRRTWDCIAPFGRFIEIGKKDAQNHGRVSLNPLLRNVVLASVELPTINRYKPLTAKRLFSQIIHLWSEGKIKEPYPLNTISYEQLEEAFRVMQSGKGMGKTVLMPKSDDIVPVVPQPQALPTLKGYASYVLSGGLGGIGRSVALWMASRGAKNLIFLSRSGPSSVDAQETIEALESRGVRVKAFACDVTDKERVAAVLKTCEETLPPIKGCIQGAMVIADKMFENMTLEKFQTATRPKVQGSWNLHCLLPKDLDFFIMLSSVNGLIGNRGQANYAAGNTFQDALAAHRVSLGLPGTSLNLGALLTVGYVAQNRERLTSGQTVAGLLGSVREDEIHSMIERHITPDGYDTRPIQVASAISTAQQYAVRGMPAPSWMYMPLFTHLASKSSASSGALGGEHDQDGLNIIGELASAASSVEVTAVISDAIRQKLSKLLSISVENIDPNKSVSSNGVDSLVAVEFRVWLAKVVGADVPLLDIISSMPIAGPTGLAAKTAILSNQVAASLKPSVEQAGSSSD